MDEDLKRMTREQLIEEAVRLREGIRRHKANSGHDLCWYQPDLWGLLPEYASAPVEVPDWPQFMAGCVRYRRSLDEQLPLAPRMKEEFNPQNGDQ